MQSHPSSYKCDGKWHTQKFVIDKSEIGENAKKVR